MIPCKTTQSAGQNWKGNRIMQLQPIHWITIFALSAMLVNSLGIWLVYRNQAVAERYKNYFMCFAAGILIATPLLIAFPEAIEKNHSAGLAALVGFIYMFFSNKYIQHRTKQPELAFGITAIQGIGIHSFIDGIIYTVTFSVSTLSGIIAGVGLVAHELSEGIITYSFLSRGGMNRKKAAFYAFLVASLTTPIGAFVAYPLIHRLNDDLLGLALGFVVGVLIYVSASHLLPEARESGRKHTYVAFFAGIALAVFLSLTHHH